MGDLSRHRTSGLIAYPVEGAFVVDAQLSRPVPAKVDSATRRSTLERKVSSTLRARLEVA